MNNFWQAMRTLRAERGQVMARLEHRHELMRQRSERLREHTQAYLGTPRSLVHGFLAGFLLDQTRPMVPQGPSPLKVLLPWLPRLFP